MYYMEEKEAKTVMKFCKAKLLILLTNIDFELNNLNHMDIHYRVHSRIKYIYAIKAIADGQIFYELVVFIKFSI